MVAIPLVILQVYIYHCIRPSGGGGSGGVVGWWGGGVVGWWGGG